MMDRIVSMTEDGGTFNKGYVEAELDINPDLCSLAATLQTTLSCLAV